MQAAYASEYRDFEKNHWWFRARREILRERVRDLPLQPRPLILEIGVGPGENLYSLYPEGAALVGVEPDPALASIARERGDIPVFEGTIEDLPATLRDSSFDAVTLFDVLEHTEDDMLSLERVREKVSHGGYVVISVPAFMFLWGQHDVVNHHYRRYTRKELVSKLERAGLQVLRSTYFSTLLFPPVALFRVLHRFVKRSDERPQNDMKYSLGPIDHLLFSIFRLEKWLLRFVNLPLGTSVLAVARKP